MKRITKRLSCACVVPSSTSRTNSSLAPVDIPTTKLDLPSSGPGEPTGSREDPVGPLHPEEPVVPLLPPHSHRPGQPPKPAGPQLPPPTAHPTQGEPPGNTQRPCEKVDHGFQHTDGENPTPEAVFHDQGSHPREESLCFVPVSAERRLDKGLSPDRQNAVLLSTKLWVNHTVIRYHLGTETSVPRVSVSDMRDAVRAAFGAWKSIGVGLEFKEVGHPADAEIRVTFQAGGSWSYVGTDNIDEKLVRFPSPTMNFGWDVSQRGRSFDTALHEVGHALGLSHEHQNPLGGLQWDERATLKRYAAYPNYWNDEKTRWNILRKLTPRDITAGTWDRYSIMHYPIGPGLVLTPDDIRQYGIPRPKGLSDGDKQWITKTYPPKKANIERRIRNWHSFRILSAFCFRANCLNIVSEDIAKNLSPS